MEMRILVTLVLLATSTSIFSQKLVDDIKRKYFGVYQGTIPAYQLDSGKDLITVEPTPITIEITAKNIILDIGKQHVTGVYTVLFQGNSYYVLDGTIEGQEANERIVVYERGKKISRDGLFPQPNVMLEKLSNKEEKEYRKSKNR